MSATADETAYVSGFGRDAMKFVGQCLSARRGEKNIEPHVLRHFYK